MGHGVGSMSRHTTENNARGHVAGVEAAVREVLRVTLLVQRKNVDSRRQIHAGRSYSARQRQRRHVIWADRVFLGMAVAVFLAVRHILVCRAVYRPLLAPLLRFKHPSIQGSICVERGGPDTGGLR